MDMIDFLDADFAWALPPVATRRISSVCRDDFAFTLLGEEIVEIDQRDHGAVDRHQSGQEISLRSPRHLRHRLNARAFNGDDVEHAVGEETHRLAADLDDDDDVHRRGVGQALPETAAQIDDRHHDAAQIEHAAHIVGLIGQLGDAGPFLDLAHCHDVDAVLLVADGKADEFGGGGAGVRASSEARRDGRRGGGIDGGTHTKRLLSVVTLLSGGVSGDGNGLFDQKYTAEVNNWCGGAHALRATTAPAASASTSIRSCGLAYKYRATPN